jgi:flavin-dependent dehydrogenase
VGCNLPFQGLGLSRRVLDEALLRHAQACGARIRRGVSLAGLSPEITFLATGKHDLRGAARKPETPPEDLVGFKIYARLAPQALRDLRETVEIILFRQGYAGLQIVENDQANLCLLIHRDQLDRAGGIWPALLDRLQATHPHLRARLHGADVTLARPLAIARVPYGFIHTPVTGEAVYRLGDQACVIPSFTGDGMSMALHSAALAVQCHLGGETPADYHRRLRADVGRPIARATALYRLGRSAIGQALLIRALQAWPGLMRRAATATRVPEPAWLRD